VRVSEGRQFSFRNVSDKPSQVRLLPEKPGSSHRHFTSPETELLNRVSLNMSHCLFNGIGYQQQLHIRGIDGFGRHHLFQQFDQSLPVFFAKQHDRKLIDLPRLN